ncbi:MAG: ATP-dependent RNA helicase HrpA, partial [Candidatus Aminicenantes bacterium]|nr:ATP-dependent RNA helicase HrpA [Candidatus Aminicenantes bacterium]
GVTQPRRLAAVTIAHRIAEELGEPLGKSVGYKIRFQDRSSRENLIKVMTDGMLLAETQGDRLLRDYGTIIIDEAHERSLNIDFLLGIVRRLLDARSDLKLVVTSATLDTEKFSQAFRRAPVIEVSGRTYPVRVEYRPPEREEAEDKDYVGQAVEAVAEIKRGRGEGDILVFMPTEQDILETCRLLEGRKFPATAVLPLFSRLPAGRQRMVYTVSGPKIVVATNVAETSLTIPGIRYVVDTGVARIARYQPGARIKSLPISPISRASADQRKGRSGRVREGVCVRLYSEADYEARDEFTPPEILRSDLAEVILRMIDLGLGDPLEFPFIDRPSAKAVRDGYDTLAELGAIMSPNSRALTEKGRAMARMPLDPRISRMLLEARAENCLAEAAVLAAVLSIRDPRERPPDKSAQADAAHEGFRHPDSDFIGLLNIWNRYHGDFEKLGTAAQKRKFCHENFLSFPRMREWVYLHDEILSVLSERRLGRLHDQVSPALYGAVHRSILAGFLSNIAVLKEKNVYTAAKNKEVMLWPGSALFKKSAGWIVATEMVKTSRLFARTAARVDPAWLERLGGALCKRSFSDAAWDRGRGEATAKERVTLFGLEIVRDRRVSYGRVNPAEAHAIFVMSGLVEGGVDDPPVFLLHNLALQKRIEALEDKLRRRDIMVSAARVAKFYSERLPGIYSVATLRKFLKDRGGDDAFLRLDEETLTNYKPGEDVVSTFPDTVEVAGRPFRAVYKFAPGEEDDGVTLNVPVSELPAIPAGRLEWGVPGQYEDKIAALIKGLPKRYRKLLVPVGEKAATIAAEMERAPEDVPLAKAVAEFVRRRFGVDIPAREWDLADVPRYLRMRLAVVDPATGRTIDAGRDVELLRKKVGAADMTPSKVESPAWREACRKWERTGIEGWTFGDLPEKIAVGTSLTAYPALEMGDMIPISQFPEGAPAGPVKSAGAAPGARRGTVSIKLFATRAEAEAAHRKGVRHLLMAKFGKELAFVRRYHKIPAEHEAAALPFGGREAVERKIEEALARETFERPIRAEAEFRAYEAEIGRTLFEKGHALTQTALRILELRHAVRAALSGGAGRGQVSTYKISSRSLNLRELDRLKERAVPEYLEQIGSDLERLVPANFLEFYTVDRLVRIPRYLEGLKIRLERARVDPDKDRAKSAQVEPYVFELARLEAGSRKPGTGIVSPNLEERAAAVDELRWMIQEFKLALFAPEIRTAHPISAVRLARKVKEIDGLA